MYKNLELNFAYNRMCHVQLQRPATSRCFGGTSICAVPECSSLYVANWALALFLVKNNRFIILHNNAVFQMPFNSPCKHTSLYFTADFFQVGDMITVVYSFNILLNNRPFI